MMTPTAEYDDNIIRELVSALSDTARTARAQKQLLHLVSSGGATTVLGLLLDRLLGQEGVRGTGARRAVAKLLEEAMSAAGVDGLPALPRLVALSARVLGDASCALESQDEDPPADFQVCLLVLFLKKRFSDSYGSKWRGTTALFHICFAPEVIK